MKRRLARRGLGFGCAVACALLPAFAAANANPPADAAAPEPSGEVVAEQATALPEANGLPQPDPGMRSGREIYDLFIAGLAQPECADGSSKPRWRQHFKHAPKRLATNGDDLLPLFGYVVDALREAGLPTEYALIPFVESGYKPGARSSSGPAGLWQFIGTTARNHGVTMQGGYDGRLSPVESTRAAVRYLKILHSMFGRDWRLAVMAYNAGEYRVLQSMRRAGVNSSNARPAELPGLSGVTYAYVEKLHSIACLLKQANDDPAWLAELDRPVPRLAPHDLIGSSLDAWARERGHDPAMLQRLNPALANSVILNSGKTLRVLAPRADGNTPEAGDGSPLATTVATSDDAAAMRPGPSAPPRTHIVQRGESAWGIAKRHGISVGQLLKRNQLDARTVLRPGMVLKLDDQPAH